MIMSLVTDERRRWFALGAVLLAFLMTILDATIVNVALPQIQSDLNFDAAGVTWVINAYLISYGAFLLVSGRLGDLIGRRRVFLLGTTLFALASAAAGASQSSGLLVVARFIQGIGGAMAAAAVLAIVVAEFPDATDRAKAMSAYIAVGVGGGSLGLLAGGVLTDIASWHWIFFVNLPIAAITLVSGSLLLEKDSATGMDQGVDFGGATLITGAMLLLVYTIVQAPDHGWGSGRTIGLFALTALLLAAFVALERRIAHPIVPARILRVPALLAMSAVRATSYITLYSVFLFGVLYLQNVLGFNPIKAGVGFLPLTLTIMACSLVLHRRLASWLGRAPVFLGGLSLIVVGLVLLMTAGAETSYFPTVFLAFLAFGFGAGNAFVPMLNLAMAEVPREDAGLASGIVNVSGQIAAAIGLAVLGTIAATRTATLRANGENARDALTGGYHTAYAVAIGFAAIAIAIAALALVSAAKRRRATAGAPDAVAQGATR
jgi:EmrB/QacA subfamily drug resistance transporter